jgi:hypothetical protein
MFSDPDPASGSGSKAPGLLMTKTSKIGQLKKIISFDLNYSFLFLCLHDRFSSYIGEAFSPPPQREHQALQNIKYPHVLKNIFRGHFCLPVFGSGSKDSIKFKSNPVSDPHP